MIAILVCDRDERERETIGIDCRRRIAVGCDEALELTGASDDAELLLVAEDERLVHLLYYDYQAGQQMEGLRLFRRRCSGAMVMLITDASVSPLEYLRPGTAPDALLLRPLNEEMLDAVNGEFMDSFFQRFHGGKADDSFVVDTREEKVFLPYSQIYYFEARDKKLFVRTKNEEYAFYDTIEGLERRLPSAFRRCHRSYIVNTEKIQRILSAENFIDLGNQIGAPISRSYKGAFKGVGT